MLLLCDTGSKAEVVMCKNPYSTTLPITDFLSRLTLVTFVNVLNHIINSLKKDAEFKLIL